MLGTLKVSRHEIFLQAKEKKADYRKIKRLFRTSDVKRQTNVVEELRLFKEKRKTGRKFKQSLAKMGGEANSRIKSLILRTADMRYVLDPEKIERNCIMTLRFSAYDKRCILGAWRASEALKQLNIPHHGPIVLPRRIRKITVLKSPFKFKKAQETWEQRVFGAVLTIDFRERGDILPTLLNYFCVTTYAGVDIRFNERRFINTPKIYTDPYLQQNLSLLTKDDDPDPSDGNFLVEHSKKLNSMRGQRLADDDDKDFGDGMFINKVRRRGPERVGEEAPEEDSHIVQGFEAATVTARNTVDTIVKEGLHNPAMEGLMEPRADLPHWSSVPVPKRDFNAYGVPTYDVHGMTVHDPIRINPTEISPKLYQSIQSMNYRFKELNRTVDNFGLYADESIIKAALPPMFHKTYLRRRAELRELVEKGGVMPEPEQPVNPEQSPLAFDKRRPHSDSELWTQK